MNYYTIIDIIACLTMVVMIFLIYEDSRFDRSTKFKMYGTYFCIFVAMTAEWAGVMLNGGSAWSVGLHRFVKCVDYTFTPLAGFMVIGQISKWGKVQKSVGTVLGINALIQIASIFFHLTYYVDASNVYHHGPIYFVYIIVYLVTLLGVCIEFYQYGKNYKKQNLSSFVSIICYIMLAVVIQEVFQYRVSYLMLVNAAILLFIHYAEFSQATSAADLLHHKEMLQTDTLTGLFSRYSYTNDMKRIKDLTTLPDNLVVFSMDVNELKTVNDTLGHLAGDELLTGASACMKKIMGRYGKCYRTGGDEFMAFLYYDAGNAYAIKKALRKELENWSGKQVKTLSMSIGYAAVCENKDATLDDLIHLADEKMYESKAQYYVQSGKAQRKDKVKRNEIIEQKNKEYIDIISAFASDVTGLYVIDKLKQEVTAYRISSTDHKIRSGVPLEQGFDTAMEQFVEKKVHPDDKASMRRNVRLEYIETELADKNSFTYHFRTLIGGEIHYHYMKCIKNKSGASYDKIVISFCPDDNMTARNNRPKLYQRETDIQKPIILIADPHEKDSMELQEILGEYYDCLTASDGQLALEMMRKNRGQIATIFYQQDMPGLSAVDFLEKTQTDIMLSSIPVIILTQQINQETEKRCIALGATDFVRKPYDRTIILNRVENFITMKSVVASLDQIEIDDLTGLYTKQAFFYHAKILLDSSPYEDFSIVISDVLNFKIYNSIYGENTGDELLKLIAGYLTKAVPNGICARYGADQFIFITKTVDADTLNAEVEQMQRYVNKEAFGSVTLKIGIYENVDKSLEVTRMCDRAMQALKSIKSTYDRSYARFDGPVSQQQLRAQVYESNFKKAMENHEFVTWYQPKYNVYTGKVIGAEALVRWINADGTLISPGEFLSVFEADGLIGQLDEHVFRLVCSQQKAWMDQGKRTIPVSVNLSRNSMHQSDVVERYKAILEEYDLKPEYVPIEITESAAVDNLEIKPLADAFYEAGFSLHMDDFGSGKSSIAGLTLLHFDTIKLDRSLVDGIFEEDGRLVLMYTVALGKELGMHLVAEGVETAEQIAYLKDIGCEGIQGYYYSKPLPAAEFEEKVAGNLADPEEKFDQKYKLTAADSVVKRAMDRMLQRMPGGFLTYRSDDKRILSSNSYLWNLFGCQSEDEFMTLVNGSFDGMVFPEDYERVDRFIAEQIQDDAFDMDYVEYRIRRKDGTLIPVVDYGHLDHQPDGDVYYVFINEANKTRI